MAFHGGLFHKPFESSIYPFSLRFKDHDLEHAYLTTRGNLELLSNSSKLFLVAALAGHFVIYLIDIIATLATNPDYKFSTAAWVFYSILIPIIISEILCFACNRLVPYRGIIFTVVGGMVLFHNDFANFEAKLFYPFVGTEYVCFV